MALEEKRNDMITGISTINGVVVERYSATIDEQNPATMTLGRTIVNQQLRKDNREECRKDQAQFEDDCYAIQDQMISQDGMVSNAEEATEDVSEEA